MICYLMALFAIKHFFADFILQTEYHLQKFKPDWSFFFPLVNHCGVHVIFTAIILYFYRPDMMWLALVDGVIHFFMDRIKAGPKYFGRFKGLSGAEMMALKSYKFEDLSDETKRDHTRKLVGNVIFWWSLGLDQLVHSLTYIYIVWKMTI